MNFMFISDTNGLHTISGINPKLTSRGLQQMQEVTMMPTSWTTISVSWDLAEQRWEQDLFFSLALTSVIPLMVLHTKAKARELKASPENSITKARSVTLVSSITLIKHHVPGYWEV